MRKRKFITLLAAVLLLSACSSGDEQPITRSLATMLAQLGKERADPLEQLTPAVVAGVTDPFLLVSLPARNTVATMAVFGQSDTNGGIRIDWRAGDGSSLVMEEDIVVATRGLGADLFLAETGALTAALHAGSGQHLRRHSWLDGENRLVAEEFYCVIIVGGREAVDLIDREIIADVITENCRSSEGDDQIFSNTYWLAERTREIVQSEQWIGLELSFLKIRHLKR